MTIEKYFISAAALLFFSAGVSAVVYKSIDARGNTVYTDEPIAGAKPVDLPPLSTIPPPSYSFGRKQERAPEAVIAAYRKISIVTPVSEATLRDNTGAVPVSASIDPPLNILAGHRFQFYLDGQTQGEPTRSSQIVLPNVNRGTHNVAVAVVDDKGKEITRSSPVRFYLHRQSRNFPRGPGAPAPVPRGR